MRTIIYFATIVALAVADEKSNVEILNDGNNVLTYNYLSAVMKEKQGQSVVVSAFSLLQQLAQVALASVGESHDQILRAIGLPNDNVSKEVIPVVNSQLRAMKGIDMNMTNRMYIPIDAEINEDFRNVSRSVFGSEIKSVNFSNAEEAAKEINDWVEDLTNKRIKDLINKDAIGNMTRAILVFAIYFKGNWINKFNVEATTDLDFHVNNEYTVKVQTMYKKGYLIYGESKELDAKLLEMPYVTDESSLLIIVPNEIEGINGLVEKLKNPADLEKAKRNMSSKEVNLYLPKFKIESTIDLRKVLPKLGITNLFNESNARLENLLKGNDSRYVSDAIQKAYIEVNEEGNECAADNVSHGPAIVPAPTPSSGPELRVDRPFYFELRAKGFILFNGIELFNSAVDGIRRGT